MKKAYNVFRVMLNWLAVAVRAGLAFVGINNKKNGGTLPDKAKNVSDIIKDGDAKINQMCRTMYRPL